MRGTWNRFANVGDAGIGRFSVDRGCAAVNVGLKEHFDALAHSRPARVPLWKSAPQSEWICKRAADALVVGASGLQTLPRLEFHLILTVRDRPQLRDPPDVDDV